MSSDVLSAVVILLIIIALCGVVIVFAPKLERLVNKRSEKSAKDEGDAFAGFVVGRVYQMEDGSFAKYIGKGKFVKVKEQD